MTITELKAVYTDDCYKSAFMNHLLFTKQFEYLNHQNHHSTAVHPAKSYSKGTVK